jgi:hypothetical protein
MVLNTLSLELTSLAAFPLYWFCPSLGVYVLPIPFSHTMCTMPEILFRFLFIKAFWLRASVLTNVMRQIDEMFHYFVTMVTHCGGGQGAA